MPVEYPYHPCKVYLPTFGLFFMVHVGKCAIHGLFGIGKSFHKIQISEAYKSIDVVVLSTDACQLSTFGWRVIGGFNLQIG